MRGVTSLISILVSVSLAGTGCVQAQTEKTIPVQYGPTPYVSQAEFQNISVGGGTSGKSSGSRTTFRDILTVPSLEEVTRHFGEPASTEYERAPGGMSLKYIVYLTYDGLDLKYRKRGEKIRLETMVITSEDWFIRVSLGLAG